MTESNTSLPNQSTELVNALQQQEGIDMETLAEKIVALLRREIEIESERSGNLPTGR